MASWYLSFSLRLTETDRQTDSALKSDIKRDEARPASPLGITKLTLSKGEDLDTVCTAVREIQIS